MPSKTEEEEKGASDWSVQNGRPSSNGPLANRQRHSRVSVASENDIIYVVGGWSREDPSCPVEQFCTQHNEWTMSAPLSRHRGDAGVCALGGLIYTVGGCDEVTCVGSVERYDPGSNTWTGDVSPLSSPRSRVCLLEMEGRLIALGGHDGVACTNTVESYDPRMNTWTKLPPMNRRRAGAAAAVMGGHLYVVGGTDGETPLDSVERYVPLDGCWCVCPPLLCPRETPGCAVFLGRLYVAGGRDDLQLELSTAEKFDPETQRWSPVKPMRSRRNRVSLMVFNGLLLAIGGADGLTDLKTMEAYEHGTNSWRHFGSMKSKHPGGHVALIKPR